MGDNEADSGQCQEVDRACRQCGCTLSVLLRSDTFTGKRRVGEHRSTEAVTREKRRCEHCNAVFFVRGKKENPCKT